jgi:hypothetical protein
MGIKRSHFFTFPFLHSISTVRSQIYKIFSCVHGLKVAGANQLWLQRAKYIAKKYNRQFVDNLPE